MDYVYVKLQFFSIDFFFGEKLIKRITSTSDANGG